MNHRICCFLLLVLAACDTTSTSRKPDKTSVTTEGNSLWDQIAAARAARKDAAPRSADEDPAAGAKALPPGFKTTIDAAWTKFLKDDPEWPNARASWLALGPPGPLLLAENLLRAHVLAFDAEDRRLFVRSRVELVERRAEAIPLLVAGLASGSGDTTVRNLSEDLLALMGDAAATECVMTYPTVTTERGKRSLARALKKSRSKVGVDTLIAVARSSEPFATRIEAVEGLGEITDPRGYDTVLACTSDPDPSVAKFACHYVSSFRNRAAIPALIDALERALRDNNEDLSASALRSLNSLASRRLPADPARWRALVRSGDVKIDGVAR